MRLLLVEDYKPLQKSIAMGMREAGFAVDVTGDGEEGFWYANSNDYDVIILDLMLPKMDGLTILRKLRKNEVSTHVLILTAKDQLDDRLEGLNSGSDDYMVKPFAFSELLARVQSLVRRKYKDKTPIVEIGDLKVNTLSQQVWRGEEEIVLTQREYTLLEYLLRRRGEVVSRTDIWDHVYDFHSSATSNVVDVYIGYLRKKIHKAELPTLIHTIRGKGYTLKAQS
ncbi:MAG: response regulator transcription factor [Planctomycetota bacterium]|nr:response regulator transcription factor [Planctomycetota bacterium]